LDDVKQQLEDYAANLGDEKEQAIVSKLARSLQ